MSRTRDDLRWEMDFLGHEELAKILGQSYDLTPEQEAILHRLFSEEPPAAAKLLAATHDELPATVQRILEEADAR